jgi:hypothetical protein
MLLTISTTHSPATDLGYLLAKRPGRCQRFPLAFGQAHVFYTEEQETRCTAALLLDIDPVELARMRRGSDDAPLAAYVSDRPYVASSFLSVAIAQVCGTALAGRCTAQPELVQTAIPLEARLAVVPARGGEALLRRLFEPLGYSVGVARLPLDETLPAWGESSYYSLTLSAVCRLDALLQHLYVLLPVLDREKHYYVGEAEVEKLLRHGVDVSPRALERAKSRLHYDELPPLRRERISLLQGSLVYRDARLAGYDAAAVVEVIEHLDPSRLGAFERALFGIARPATVVLTTPNRDYNVRYGDLSGGALRHADHRFEWTRAEFAGWAAGVAARNGYSVRFQPVGEEDADLGAPTQLGVFSRNGGSE